MEQDNPQANTQAHTITDPDTSLLRISLNFLGRGGKIAEISGLLNRPDGGDLIVIGLAGNGKTTICHHVLQQWLRDVPGRVVYLVELEFITTVLNLARALGSLCGLAPEHATPEHVLASLANLPHGTLYLDNLESVLADTTAHRFLQQLQGCANLSILASSRREVASFERIRLDVLEEEDALNLFQLIWQQQTGKLIDDQALKQLEDFVTKDLGCHPLSIEITSSHADTVANFSQLVEEFHSDATTYFKRFASDEQGRLNNLDQSLGLSLSRLKDRPNALRLLALCAVYETGLNGPMQQLLLQNKVFTPADRSVLLERNLARYAEGFLSVLPPVVRFLRKVLSEEGTLFVKGLVFQDGAEMAKNKAIPVPNRLEFLAFYAASDEHDLESVIETFDGLDFLKNLFLARPILERLVQSVLLQSPEKRNVLGWILRNLGEIDFREGNNDMARKRYLQADNLYLKTGSDQGRANLLKNLGEIDFLEGNNDMARKRYLQADNLYLKTGDDQGRAHIQHYIAQIANTEENYPAAKASWTNALSLYRNIAVNRDVAETLLYLAELNIKLDGTKPEMEVLLTEAAELIKQFGISSMEEKLARLQLHLDE